MSASPPFGDRAWAVALAVCVGAVGCGGGDDGGADPRASCSEPRDGFAALYKATAPTGERPEPASLDETVRIICERARAQDVDAGVRRRGADQLEISVPPEDKGAVEALARPAQLAFYDWEPNVFGDPDEPLARDQAVESGTKRKPRVEAEDQPDDRGNDLMSPAADAPEVPRGVAIVRDEGGYFVIEDDAELSGREITNPEQNHDSQTDEPIVTFDFTDPGADAFARMTRRVAERGAATGGDSFQRFAIVLDGEILSLATINHMENPQGIPGDSGAQLNGIGSLEETRRVAENLRIGALPVRLERFQ